MNTMLNNKKGQMVQQVMLVGIFLFVFALVAIVCYFAFTQINTAFQASDMTAAAKTANQGVLDKYPSYVDGGVLFIMVGMFIAVIVASLVIVLHPALAILYFIALVIITYVMALLSNAYQDIVANASFQGLTTSFPIMSSLVGWLPVFVFFFGIVAGIVAFKLRGVLMQ